MYLIDVAREVLQGLYISLRGAGYPCLHTNFHNLLTRFSQISELREAEARKPFKKGRTVLTGQQYC